MAECGPLLVRARDAFEQVDAAQLSAAGADRWQPYHDAVDAVVRCAQQHLTAAQIDLVYRFLRDEAWRAQAVPVEGLIARSQPPIATSRHTELSDQYTRAELEAIRDQVLMEEAKKVPGVQGVEPSRLREQHPVKVRSLAPVKVIATAAPPAMGDPPWTEIVTSSATVESLRGLFVEQPLAVTRFFWQDVGPVLVARVQGITPAAQASPQQQSGSCWYRGERLVLDDPACVTPSVASLLRLTDMRGGRRSPATMSRRRCRPGAVAAARSTPRRHRSVRNAAVVRSGAARRPSAAVRTTSRILAMSPGGAACMARSFPPRRRSARSAAAVPSPTPRRPSTTAAPMSRAPATHPRPAKASPRWCCLHGEVFPAPPQECEERGGRPFPNPEEAERHCRADEPRPGDAPPPGEASLAGAACTARSFRRPRRSADGLAARRSPSRKRRSATAATRAIGWRSPLVLLEG